MDKIPIFLVFIIGFSFIPFSFSEEIPEWVKNNASWWSERQISQSEFTNGLEYLINEGIIYIPPTETVIPGPDKIIPDWVRNTAGWWATNQIPDSEFINAMKYLIEIGIIEVNTSTPESTLEETIEETSELPVVTGTPLHIVFEGYSHANSDSNFALDVKIFDKEKYFATYGRAQIPIDGVDVDISLYDEENELIHSFSDVTKNGKMLYDVLAKETSLDPPRWKIGQVYTVDVTASLDGQIINDQYHFFGTISTYEESSDG